ncbi:cytochrome P450 [Fodinicola acaciae]|uniref:cytochrome P450 n=1 Tax=Fodinicola acaciae TaxID=2681555 RepID=UPI001FE99D96|nr:cytochrome P450 [Fodinicola acaciae]
MTRTFPMSRQCPYDPPPDYGRLRESEPVSRVRTWDGTEAWLITRYADSRAVLADRRFSSDSRRPGYPSVSAASAVSRRQMRSFINMDDPEHAHFRRMLISSFTMRQVEALRPRIQSIVDSLVDDILAAGPPVDLVQAFALPLPSLVICELLGVPYADHDRFQAWSRTTINAASTAEQAQRAVTELAGYLGELVDAKDREPGDDLISRLVVNQLRPGHVTRADVVGMARLLLVAGHETTANMIALGTAALLAHPDQLERLRTDPSVVKSSVEELLRYLTITHSGRRRVATEDVTVSGQLISAGEAVIVAGDAANRDPEVFAEPDQLDVARKARQHVAFGYGIHQCLGQPLARVELQVVHGTLYGRIPTLKLAIPAEQLRFKHDMIVYGVHELPVSW